MRVPGHQRKSYTWRWTAALAALAVVAFALVMGVMVRPAERAQAVNFTVDNLTDNGALNACTSAANDCSLRGALGVANGNGVADHITFLSGLTGTIPITATLPVSEVGFATNVDGTGGGSTAPSIVIDCGGGAYPGFTVTTAGNTIRDLSIVNCSDGILIDTEPADTNTVAGNWIGLNPSGTVVANTLNGVHIDNGADSNIIGGSTAADRNVISGNGSNGILIANAASDNNIVRGNYIGTDATGMVAKPNGAEGIAISAGTGTIVGGSTAGQGNVISHNNVDGIGTARPVVIQGNLIGLASDGITPMANGADGVYVTGGATDVTIGDTGTTAAMPGRNVIAHNGWSGVGISGAATQRVKVARNSIFENGRQGISLVDDNAVTQCPPPNGGGAGDGSNGDRDCPAILSVTYTSGTFLVAGSVNVAEFLTGSRVDVYEVVADSHSAGQGKTWLAGFNVVNDGVTASWGGNVCVNGPTQISAVATDVNGNSSEFALNVNVPSGTCSGAATPTAGASHFYGSVTLNGYAAAAGTSVTATINGYTCGTTTVDASSNYAVDVASNSTTGCGTNGATVNFTVGGCADGSGTWESGMSTNLPLTASCTLTPTPTAGASHFYGSVTLNGYAAAAGTAVTATVNGYTCGSTTVDASSNYAIDVSSSTYVSGCGTNGATVTFTVGGCTDGSGTWESGWSTNLPLTASCAATATPTPYGYLTPTPTTGAMASVTLVAGCNPVASSYPDSTGVATIAGAVSPSTILISVWKFDTATSTWLGYSPQAPQASDLTAVDRLDAIFICVSSAGTWSRPVI